MQVVSPQNRAVFRAIARFFAAMWRAVKSGWLAFLKRFAPFWAPLVLVLVLPMPREIAGVSGPLFRRGHVSHFYHALDEPDNLGAQLNVLSSIPSSVGRSLLSNEESSGGVDIPTIDEWLQRIESRFHQPWVPASLVETRFNFLSLSWPPLTASESLQNSQLIKARLKAALPLRQLLDRNIGREPDNAFWVVQRARWEWTFSRRFPLLIPKANRVALSSIGGTPPVFWNDEPVLERTLDILARARRCTRFEDGWWPANREMQRDFYNRYGDSLEDRLNWGRNVSDDLWIDEVRGALWNTELAKVYSSCPPGTPPLQLKPPASRFSRGQFLAWGEVMAHVGALKDAAPSSARSGRQRFSLHWLDVAWNLDVPPTPGTVGRVGFPRSKGAAAFLVQCQKARRPDLGSEALRIEGEVAARDALLKRANAHSLFISEGLGATHYENADALIPPFALWSAVWCDLLAQTAVYLAPLWMFLNFWLIRGRGQPSSTRARWVPALLLIGPLFGLCAYLLSESAPGTGKMARLFEVAPPLSGAFAGTLAVLLAIVCSVGTVARRADELVGLEDDKWHTHLLPPKVRPWLEPVLLGCSALIVLTATIVLAHFVLSAGAGTAPVPPGFLGVNTALGAVAFGAYGLFTGAIAFFLWLVNWRWSAKAARPITHGGLRWWKETLGASICVLLWLYLLVALAAWPTRTRAKAMLEERWRVGDWVWLQKNA